MSRITYLSANPLRDTYTGTPRPTVPPNPAVAQECPQSVRPAGGVEPLFVLQRVSREATPAE
jgi:hypothetical protein